MFQDYVVILHPSVYATLQSQPTTPPKSDMFTVAVSRFILDPTIKDGKIEIMPEGDYLRRCADELAAESQVPVNFHPRRVEAAVRLSPELHRPEDGLLVKDTKDTTDLPHGC